MAILINCPDCARKLRVPDNLLGKRVKCPSCGTLFTAASTGEPEPTAEAEERVVKRPAAPPPEEPERYQFADDQEQTEEPPPRRRRRPRPPEDEYDEEPEDEEEYDEPRPRRRRRGSKPHRGTLILVLGILSLVVCAFLGPFAWVMGNTDLREMRAGRMDREGEGTTNAGRICGMISTILMIVGCLIYGVIFLLAVLLPVAGKR